MFLTLFDIEDNKLSNIINNPEDVGTVLRYLENVPRFALDLETTGLDHLRDTIHGYALATEDKEWYIYGAGVKPLEEGLKTIVPRKEIIGHHIKFDAHFLNRVGLYPRIMLDTMVMQALIDENQTLGLKSLAERKLHTGELPSYKTLAKRLAGDLKIKGNVAINQMPPNILGQYAARDARLTYDLATLSFKELEHEGLTEVFFNVEVPFINILIHMEQAGLYIDLQRLEELKHMFSEKLEDAIALWKKISGGANPDSPKQVADVLFNKMEYTPTEFTSTNQPKTDIMTLNRLKSQDKTGAVAALLGIRQYTKLINTYVTTFLKSLIEGRLHGTFNQSRGEGEEGSSHGTVTWRLSSNNPNLQNIPTRTKEGQMIRATIAAPEGYVLVVSDYSQLELRLAAHYSRDPGLTKAYTENLDLHQMTADRIGVARHIGKTINFLKLYGGGPRKLADTLEINGYPRPSQKEAAEWLDAYDKSYPVYTQWAQKVVHYARKLGYVTTLDGHKRRLPDLNSELMGLRMKAERQAVNSVIQGSASAIAKRAMLDIFPHLCKYDAKMLAQVHDEIVLEVPKHAAPEFASLVKEKMEVTREFFQIRVPLIAEPGIGNNWADAK